MIPQPRETEAKALMAAAGVQDGIKGLDFLVRDVASFKVWAQAIQAMLQETLNIQCNLRTSWNRCGSTTSRIGHFDLAIGAVVSTLLDPSDYFNAWYQHRRAAELFLVQQRQVRCDSASDRSARSIPQAPRR